MLSKSSKNFYRKNNIFTLTKLYKGGEFYRNPIIKEILDNRRKKGNDKIKYWWYGC